MTKEFAFDKYISDTFRSIGIMPNVKGYQYLSYAVKLVVDAGKMLKITREVYPEVAKHFCVTSVQVERAIRHAITTCWGRVKTENKMNNVNRIFGRDTLCLEYHPTNGALISLLVDNIMLIYQSNLYIDQESQANPLCHVQC